MKADLAGRVSILRNFQYKVRNQVALVIQGPLIHNLNPIVRQVNVVPALIAGLYFIKLNKRIRIISARVLQIIPRVQQVLARIKPREPTQLSIHINQRLLIKAEVIQVRSRNINAVSNGVLVNRLRDILAVDPQMAEDVTSQSVGHYVKVI